MDRKLSHDFTEPIISAALNFIDENLESQEVLIHCNKGQSRSPGLAMLFLAKRRDEISNTSYQQAKEDFRHIYRRYRPERGIEAYLTDFWDELE